jgi:hypothetical protein
MRLRRPARSGRVWSYEVWAFSDPSASSKQGRLTGYALVRNGEIVESVTLS